MAKKNPSSFASSSRLVPVYSVLPEQRPGDGAITVMRDGSFRMIVRTGAVNFDMKSHLERGALTFQFGAMLDSLEVGFPIEIVSHARIIDIESYVRQFEPRLANTNTPEAIRNMIESHIAHFREQVQNNRILQRELYVIIPWKGASGAAKASVIDDIPFAGLFKAVAEDQEAKRMIDHKPTDLEIATARQQLEIRSHQIVGRLANMQIWTKKLNEDEIRKLLYGLFHPGLSERQRDPGYDSGGSLLGGFSAERLPQPQRRITDGRELEAPSFE